MRAFFILYGPLSLRQIRHAISASTRTPTISAPHTSSVFQPLCCSVADVAVNRFTAQGDALLRDGQR
jgi:hypothetical protein